jgi:hypothetical protein
VKIEGVEHEFMTIPEVAEDVTDIILNLKEVLLQIHTNEVKTIRIEADGPKEIKAGDIIADGQVEVLNPGHHILTIREGGRVRMEMTARRGRSYVSADKNKVPGAPLGTIPIDALFSPIRKVNYQVTNARVGQQTDYDKLTLEVWTDGSILPNDAIAVAAKILRDLGIILHAAMMVNPDFTADDFLAMRRSIDAVAPAEISFTVFSPPPGTALWEKHRKDFICADPHAFYDCMHTLLPTRLPLNDFYRYFSLLYLFGFRHNPWRHRRIMAPLRDLLRMFVAGARCGHALRTLHKDYPRALR